MFKRLAVLAAIYFAALTLFVGVANAIAGAAVLSLNTLLAIAIVSAVIAVLRVFVAGKTARKLDWPAIVWVVLGVAITVVTAFIMSWLTYGTILAYILLGVYTAFALIGEYRYY